MPPTKRRSAKAVLAEADGLKLLGHVVTFGSRSASTHRYADVVQALKDAGLNPAHAKRLLPEHAFSRACHKMRKEHVIDELTEDGDSLTFQLTNREKRLDGAGDVRWVYSPETLLTLDTKTGRVACKDGQIEARAQELLDQALDTRTTLDITNILRKLFGEQADLLPVPGAIGVYVVPIEYADFLEQIRAFLHALGRKPHLIPIPAGTKHGDEAVQAAVESYLEEMIAEHLAKIDEFSVTTRPHTIRERAAKITETRVKIRAYAEYLGDLRDKLLETVDDADQRLLEKVHALTAEKSAQP